LTKTLFKGEGAAMKILLSFLPAFALVALSLNQSACFSGSEGGSDGGGTDGGGTVDGGGNCGNGSVDPGEDCEPSWPLTSSCQEQGFGGGSLSCGADCMFDTMGCEVLATCGNGRLDTSEICEGFDMRGRTCVSEGFTGGELVCTARCSLDRRGCEICGNGKLEAGEGCDGQDFGAESCATQRGPDYAGALACDSSCQYIDSDACILQPKRGGSCQLDAPSDRCEPGTTCVGIDPYLPDTARCMIRCAQTQLGQSAGCPAGEQCLKSAWLELQPGDPSCQAQTDCLQSEGYSCGSPLNFRHAGSCVRPITACGTPTTWVGDYSTMGVFPGPSCTWDTQDSSHNYCALPTGSPSPLVVCDDTRGVRGGVCLAYCDGEGGPDLPCMPGYVCRATPNQELYLRQRDAVGNPIVCVGDAECKAPNTCLSLQVGSMCARPAKVCVFP